jgi:hypothetical protein
MYRLQMKAAALAVCAAMAAAGCQRVLNSPTTPTAVRESVSALNADGSNLKVTAPIGLHPQFEASSQPLSPTLSGRVSFGLNITNVPLAYRFQLATDEAFSNVVSTGTGAVDASGIVRYSVTPSLSQNQRYVWRFRAEYQDAVGPWSSVMAFSTVTSGGVPIPPPGTGGPAGPRPADPPPGQRLPLPDMRGVLARFADARDSCPQGLKYINNPWQDRVIDAFRQIDSRWGYNAKPNRSAIDNNGVPVVAAGDEAAYHYGPGPSHGSPDVHLVDMLISHCGSPQITWRVFTGEEPGIWTGAGRF